LLDSLWLVEGNVTSVLLGLGTTMKLTK
jgi:hypothetical protein